MYDDFDEEEEDILDCSCGVGDCLSKCFSMRLLSVRSLVLLFFVLSLLFLFTMLITSDSMVRNVNCGADTLNIRPMVNSAETLSIERFTEEYVSLSDKVELLGPGERLVHSFFSYFSKKSKVVTKGKMLIAVVTTQKYLLTRAQAIKDTWAQDLGPNNRLYFFVGEDCDTSDPSLRRLPIIKVSGVRDNVYPPQEKVFSVLTYVYQRFGEDYKWFVRADDDVYIRVRKLESMLDSMNWMEKLYVGHPGYGKSEDRRRLKLLAHENYCMGGPGIIFSATALSVLSLHLKRCLKAVESYNSKWGKDIGWYNEDVELGRCISRTVGINCIPPMKEPFLFFPDYRAEALNYTSLWRRGAFAHAITIHPVKQPQNLFSIHHFYKSMEYKALQAELLSTQFFRDTLCRRLPENLVPPTSYGSDCLELRANSSSKGDG